MATRKYHFLVVGVPLSPLHNCVSIAQELCLRGHNVTVMSFADRGRQKVAKYSPKCKLNYISLGELPVSDDKEEALVREMLTTNSTMHQAGRKSASGCVSSAYGSAGALPTFRHTSLYARAQ
ncbi:Ugt1a1 [Symbiodinium pilosum]|uniref:Ugt1a1 protein n=1 Tax=Symbiodinium pilosum TaxID=2952 RepID=A0A812Q0K1_SYMPI|nr:Ugt1a1 [Symbiodinium pilosum]